MFASTPFTAMQHDIHKDVTNEIFPMSLSSPTSSLPAVGAWPHRPE
jgi:hypothetical protein